MAKELKIRFVGDSSGLKKAADDSEGILSGFGKKIGAFSVASGTLIADGLKAGFSALGGLLGDSIGGASDLNESMSKVGQLFGESSDAVVAFAESAAVGLGQSKQQALDAASTFATFGKAAGLAGDDLLNFSTSNTTMASDFASFFNTSPEEAIEKIGAAFRGEAEPIRSFGILLDADSVKAKAVSLGLVQASVDTLKLSKAQETAEKAGRTYAAQLQKFGEGSVQASDAARDLEQAQMALSSVVEGSIPDLTTQQKVLATQQIIMDQGSAAMGDFAKTSDGLANKQRILAAQFTNLKTNIGQAFLPIVLSLATAFQTKVMPVLEKFGPLIGKEIAGSFMALVASVKDFRSGLTSNGLAGIFERIGIAIGYTIDWVKKLIATFQSGGWQAALMSVGTQLRDVWLRYMEWFYGTVLPAVGGALLTLGKKMGAWIADVAVPYLQANLPVWLGIFNDWFTGTALPWLGEKVGILAGILGGWIGQAAQYLADNLPGWIATFADWYTGTAVPWVLEKMGELAVQLGEWVKQGAVYLRDNLPGWLGDFAKWFTGTALPWLIERGNELAFKLADWVADSAVQLLRNLPGWITKFEGWVRTDALPAMVGFGKDAAVAIKDALIGGMNFMGELGGQIVDGLIDGLWSQAGRLGAEVQSFIASTIPGPVRDLLGLGGGGGSLPSMSSQRASGSSFVTQSLEAASAGAGSWQAANITVPVSIDGRQVALATAPYSRELQRMRA